MDYQSGPYQVVFPPGVTVVTFHVPITVDDVSERKENFRLVIRKNSLPSGITIGESLKATVVILD